MKLVLLYGGGVDSEAGVAVWGGGVDSEAGVAVWGVVVELFNRSLFRS